MTPMFESWEVEDYCPGKPLLPHGCYKYKEVSGADRFYYLNGKSATHVSCYLFEYVGKGGILMNRPCFGYLYTGVQCQSTYPNKPGRTILLYQLCLD